MTQLKVSEVSILKQDSVYYDQFLKFYNKFLHIGREIVNPWRKFKISFIPLNWVLRNIEGSNATTKRTNTLATNIQVQSTPLENT